MIPKILLKIASAYCDSGVPNKHVGWNFSKTIINVQLGIVSENPSKITIRYKKL